MSEHSAEWAALPPIVLMQGDQIVMCQNDGRIQSFEVLALRRSGLSSDTVILDVRAVSVGTQPARQNGLPEEDGA